MPPLKKPRTATSKTSTKRTVAAAANPASSSSTDLYEQVRRRAYELYEQHGRQDGFAMRDWLQAEAEVKTTRFA